jgi:hypothetical protein
MALPGTSGWLIGDVPILAPEYTDSAWDVGPANHLTADVGTHMIR